MLSYIPISPLIFHTDLSRNFLRQPQDLKVYLQEVAMFECHGDGLPTPNVTWYKDNSILREGKGNTIIYPQGVLEISPVEFADFGTYYCQVENAERARSSQLARLEQNGNTGQRSSHPRSRPLATVESFIFMGTNIQGF